jgi:radical SAM superfamily enzyme YgiQ (UPF0313 family)
MVALLDAVRSTSGVKHVFISSGMRMALLLKTPELLQKIITSHIPGSMKIAPEHTEEDILRLMHKEPHATLQQFIGECRNIAAQQGREIDFTPYVISAHPGSTVDSAHTLVRKMKELNLSVRNFQDFTPTPGTLSTAMFVTGLDPLRKKKIRIATPAEKSQQRAIMEQSFHRRGNTVQSPKIFTRRKR